MINTLLYIFKKIVQLYSSSFAETFPKVERSAPVSRLNLSGSKYLTWNNARYTTRCCLNVSS